MYGLDLFTGIGGLTKALEGYVTPVAYCENDRYATAVLLSRMASGELPIAPVWDDIRTFDRRSIFPVDIVYGGFPCQDISVAGRGAGLEGKRSGLFSEVARLVGEIRPAFVFLENVPAITTRGGLRVTAELTALGYDARWCFVSAADVGANHRRERWWLLANAKRSERWPGQSTGHDAGRQNAEREKTASGARASGANGGKQIVAHTNGIGRKAWKSSQEIRQRRHDALGCRQDVADTTIDRRLWGFPGSCETPRGRAHAEAAARSWWAIEPAVGRVVNGLPSRVDRLKALGNAVVPAQARRAYEILSGRYG
jgi:DNA (cytosine-5)-methyltransferase 1